MEKRHFDNLGIETSLLGFGCMRFPTLADGSIDVEQTEKMIDAAYEAGVTYYDTAYFYHDGNSERVLGKILEKYPRDSYYLTTKLPMFLVKEKADVERLLTEQLEKLQKDHVDFYLLHALDKEKWENAKAVGVLEECERLRAEGKFKYLGFSFHDSYEVFEEIIKAHPWDVCQIQYNYVDTENQAGDKGYELSKELGIPMVIMEPVRGGNLARFADDIEAKFHAVNPEASVASYALRWVASHENVKVVLSGMSNVEQTMDNLNTFTNYAPLNDTESAMIDDVVATLRSRVANGCTGCSYCMPCPAGVNIPMNFRVWNEFHVYMGYESVKFPWENFIGENERPHNCIECGKCESLCPQHISIREDLKKAESELEAARNAQ